MTIENSKAAGPVLGNETQEVALAELIAPGDRALLHRGYERSIDAGGDCDVFTVLAWVSTDDGSGIGLFRIAPDGGVAGDFDANRPRGEWFDR